MQAIDGYRFGAQLEACCIFAEEHMEEMIGYVNRYFDENRASVSARITDATRKILTPLPVHFEWRRGSCSWDRSGELKDTGKAIDVEQALENCFQEEYSGFWEPSYESGCGKNWVRLGDSLSDETRSIGDEAMMAAICKFMESSPCAESFCQLSEDEIWYFTDRIHDDVFDNTPASELFFFEGALDYAGLSAVSVGDFLAVPHTIPALCK